MTDRSLAAPTVHGLFEARAAGEDAGSVALVHDGRRLTYAELDTLADGVRDDLRRNGVRPGDLVGIRTGRGPSGIAAMLGIMKAGAAYVPLDDDPPERVRHVLATGGVSVVVGSPAATSSVADLPGSVTVVVPGEGSGVSSVGDGVPPDPAVVRRAPTEPDAAPGQPDAAPAGPDAAPVGPEVAPAGVGSVHDPALPAYVIFTSGSTGAPKGAAMPHFDPDEPGADSSTEGGPQ